MLSFDLYCGESGRQGPTGHDVLRADRVDFGIEIDEVAGPHIDRADAETHGAGIEAIEIDQVLERRLERAGIVYTGGARGSGWIKPRRWKAWREEPGSATDQSNIGAYLVQPLPRSVALCRKQALTPITIR